MQNLNLRNTKIKEHESQILAKGDQILLTLLFQFNYTLVTVDSLLKISKAKLVILNPNRNQRALTHQKHESRDSTPNPLRRIEKKKRKGRDQT